MVKKILIKYVKDVRRVWVESSGTLRTCMTLTFGEEPYYCNRKGGLVELYSVILYTKVQITKYNCMLHWWMKCVIKNAAKKYVFIIRLVA